MPKNPGAARSHRAASSPLLYRRSQKWNFLRRRRRRSFKKWIKEIMKESVGDIDDRELDGMVKSFLKGEEIPGLDRSKVEEALLCVICLRPMMPHHQIMQGEQCTHKIARAVA